MVMGMAPALVGRTCRHLHAVIITSVDDPAERWLCQSCGATWSELPRFGADFSRPGPLADSPLCPFFVRDRRCS